MFFKKEMEIESLKKQLAETKAALEDCREDYRQKTENDSRIFIEKDEEISRLNTEVSSLCSKSDSFAQNVQNLEKEHFELEKQYNDALTREKVFKDGYFTMKDQLTKVQETIEGYIRDISDQKQIIKRMQAIMDVLARQTFDKEYIEIALVKTYRGFEYLYKDGNFVSVNDASSVRIYYDKDEKVSLEVNS